MEYKIAIVASEFNKEISDNLIKGAITESESDLHEPIFIDFYKVPGAFELPGTISKVLKGNKKYDAIIAFGCVIKGETAHFEYISHSVSKGLMDLNIKDSVNIPIMFGVLTAFTFEQAVERSKYIGNDVMKAAIDTIKLYENIK